MQTKTERPTVQLTGTDGNAFAVMGACNRAAKKAGWTAAELSELRDEFTSGDYDHLLMTAQKHFDVN